MSKTLILVPARFSSSRFPGKPLAMINGKAMIEYVVENCAETGFDYAVVTDNDEIEKFLNSKNANVVRVDDEVTTGSERIGLALERHFSNKNYDRVINVQGDEPLLTSSVILELDKAHANSNFDIYTAVKTRNDAIEFDNPNIVKCVKSALTDQCLYFSRSAIPYQHDSKDKKWLQHVGVYSYKTEALKKFYKSKESSLENSERLEQLRALEIGMSIGAIEVEIDLIGVDVPEDIKKIEGRLS